MSSAVADGGRWVVLGASGGSGGPSGAAGGAAGAEGRRERAEGALWRETRRGEGPGQLMPSRAPAAKKEPLQSCRRDWSVLEARKPPKVAALGLKDKFTPQGHQSEFPLFPETFCSHLYSGTMYI